MWRSRTTAIVAYKVSTKGWLRTSSFLFPTTRAVIRPFLSDSRAAFSGWFLILIRSPMALAAGSVLEAFNTFYSRTVIFDTRAVWLVILLPFRSTVLCSLVLALFNRF